jgi:zinc protease
MVNTPSEALPLVIELESDRMQHLVLREEHVARERDVVANERRETVDDDVDGKLNELLYTNSFSRHAYRFPTIGTMADIQGLTTDDCQRFYATYYAPNNATLVVVGDVNADAVIDQIEEAYGDMPRVDIPAESPRTEPVREQPTDICATLPSATAKLAVAYPSPAMSSADHAVLELVNEVLFGGRASRAHRTLVHDMECAQDVHAYVGPFRDPSLYEMHVTARQGVGTPQLLAGLDEVLGSLQRCPIAAADLRRARARLELDALRGMDSVTGRAEQIGFCEVVLGDPGALFDRLRSYEAVTPERAMTVAHKYLRTEGRTVVRIEPAGAEATP